METKYYKISEVVLNRIIGILGELPFSKVVNIMGEIESNVKPIIENVDKEVKSKENV